MSPDHHEEGIPPHTARVVGAVALLVMGAAHAQEYLGGLTFFPIGPLFLANAAAAFLLGATLLAPTGHRVRLVAAVAAIGVATGALVALVLAFNGGIFGFQEQALRPSITVSIVSEALVVASLATWLVLQRIAGAQLSRSR